MIFKCSREKAEYEAEYLKGCGANIDGVYKQRTCDGCEYREVPDKLINRKKLQEFFKNQAQWIFSTEEIIQKIEEYKKDD